MDSRANSYKNNGKAVLGGDPRLIHDKRITKKTILDAPVVYAFMLPIQRILPVKPHEYKQADTPANNEAAEKFSHIFKPISNCKKLPSQMQFFC